MMERHPDTALLIAAIDEFFIMENSSFKNLLDIEETCGSGKSLYRDEMDVGYYLHERLIPYSDTNIHWRYKNDSMCFSCFRAFNWIMNKSHYCAYIGAYFCADCTFERKGLLALYRFKTTNVNINRFYKSVPVIESRVSHDYVSAHQQDSFICLSHWIPNAIRTNVAIYTRNAQTGIYGSIYSKIFLLVERLENVVELIKLQKGEGDLVIRLSSLTMSQKLLLRDVLFIYLYWKKKLESKELMISLQLFSEGGILDTSTLKADCKRLYLFLQELYNAHYRGHSELCPICKDKRKPLDLSCITICKICGQHAHSFCYSPHQCPRCFKSHNKRIQDAYNVFKHEIG